MEIEDDAHTGYQIPWVHEAKTKLQDRKRTRLLHPTYDHLTLPHDLISQILMLFCLKSPAAQRSDQRHETEGRFDKNFDAK